MSENKGWRSETMAVHAGEAIDPAPLRALAATAPATKENP